MDGNHSASVAATASLNVKKKRNKASERKGERRRGGEKERESLAPPLLISANGFCRARREPYAIIMQQGGETEGLGVWGGQLSVQKV